MTNSHEGLVCNLTKGRHILNCYVHSFPSSLCQLQKAKNGKRKAESGKRKAKSEKRKRKAKAKSEKRKAKPEKRKAKSEKRKPEFANLKFSQYLEFQLRGT